jgi:hypothetical protein
MFGNSGGDKREWWLVAVVLIGAGVLWVWSAGVNRRAAEEKAQLEAFTAKLDSWLAKPASTEPGTAYVRGKLLPILHHEQRSGCGIERELFAALPHDLKATSPDEVGTVVWLEWRSEFFKYARFSNGYAQNAYTPVCKLTVIDKTRNSIVDQRIFRGIDPDTASKGKDLYEINGIRPYGDILVYLRSLPRK